MNLWKPIFKGIKAEDEVWYTQWCQLSVGRMTFLTKRPGLTRKEPLAQKYEERIVAPLPSGFESDYERIAKMDTDEQKLTAVMAAVQARVVYFGDWRRLDAEFCPAHIG